MERDLQTVNAKQRRRSKQVTPLLVTVVAGMIVSGCSQQETQTARCVDANGNVLPDALCQGTRGGVYTNTYSYPHWVYGGSGGTVIGSHATGFSVTPSAGARTVTPSGTVVRGGFGAIGEGHASSGGEGHGSFGRHGSFGGGHGGGE